MILLAASILFLVFSNPAFGASGQTAATFLDIDVNPRSVAMGEAAVALDNGAYAAHLNPASLAHEKTPSASFMYNDFLANLNHQYAAFSYPGTLGGFAFAFNRLGTGKIASFDASGNSLGTLEAASMAGSFAWGAPVTSFFDFGATAKFIQEDLAVSRANAVAMDLGAMIHHNAYSGGLTLNQWGSRLKFDQEKFSLPRNLRFGGAYYGWILNHDLTTSVELLTRTNRRAVGALGLEYGLRDSIFLRAGYRSSQDIGSQARLGFGFKFKNMRLDYAWAGFGDLGMAHRFGLTFDFPKTGSPRAQTSKSVPIVPEPTTTVFISRDAENAVVQNPATSLSFPWKRESRFTGSFVRNSRGLDSRLRGNDRIKILQNQTSKVKVFLAKDSLVDRLMDRLRGVPSAALIGGFGLFLGWLFWFWTRIFG